MNHPLLAKRLCSVLIAAITISMLVSCGGAAERSQKYLDKAEEYYQSENYKKAKVEIKNVLQINPKNADARVLLARINQREGDHRQAFQNFISATEDDTKQIDARIELAKIYLAGKREGEAREYIDQVLAIDPANTQAKGLLSGILMQSGDRDGAAVLAKEVVEKNPQNFQAIAVLAALYVESDLAYVNQVIDKGLMLDTKSTSLQLLKIEILKQENKFSDAAAIYDQLIKDHPDNFKHYDNLTTLYISQQQMDKAQDVLRLAITNNPNAVEPVVALVSLVRSLEGGDKAVMIAKELIAKQPERYDLKKILVSQYIQDNKLDEAKDFLSSTVSKSGNNPESLAGRADLAKIYLAEKNIEKSRQLLKEIFAIEQTNTDALIIRAKIQIEEKNYKDAIADLRLAIKNEPRLAEAHKLLALAQEQDGSPELALDSYFSAIEIDGRDIASLFGASRLSAIKNDFATSRKLLQRIIDLQPTNVLANEMLLDLMLNNREWENSEAMVNKLISSDDVAVKANGYAMLGKIMGRQEQWSEAAGAYANSGKLSPKSYAPLAGQVNALLAQSKINQAVEVINKYLEANPDGAAAKRLLANIYNKQEKKSEAIAIYKSLIAAYPQDNSNYQSLAGIYLSQKQESQAEQVYLDAIENNPNAAASMRLLLGSLYINQKKYQAAETQYQKAYDSAPHSDLIRNNFANLLVNNLESEKNLQKALDLVSGFANSNEAVYLDTLGWVHFKAGNTPQAISYLQKSVGIKDVPEFRYHLGEALMKNGQHEQARREFTLALQNDVAGEWVKSAKASLESLSAKSIQ